MAMLAEPRNKKHYTLTPRGKALYEDDTRYGTKMLEKMGWSKGKGLGINENGIKDFVRVSLKKQTSGLGYEDRDDQWTEHADSFEGLLKSLNGNSGDENADNEEPLLDADVLTTRGFGFSPLVEDTSKKLFKDKLSGESLEKKSKISKARVHYKKFTKGKDLTQYSEKDLANIFGVKVGEAKQESIDQDESHTAGFVSTGLSVSDYFKQKMDSMKARKSKKLILENTKAEMMQPQQDSDEENGSAGETRKRTKICEHQEAKIEHNEVKAKKKKKTKRQQICAEANASSTDQAQNAQEAKSEPIFQSDDLLLQQDSVKEKANDNAHKKVKATFPNNVPATETQEVDKKKKREKKVKKVKNDERLLEASETIAKDATIKVSKLEIPKSAISQKENTEIVNNETLQDTYTISTFCAEKFRHADLQRFNGSTLSHIVGYSFNNKLKVEIKKIKGDELRITQLWNCTLNKYANAASKNTFYKYTQDIRAARKAKQKPPRFHVKTWKRMQAFKSL